MADAPTIGSVLAAVVPVVVGGVMALIGGGGMQWYLHRDKTQTDRLMRKADKFEAFVAALFEHEHWLEDERAKYVMGREIVLGPTPFGKLQGLAAVYFPEFEERVDELGSCVLDYEKWMMAEGKRAQVTKGEVRPDESFKKAYGSYWTCRCLLLEEVRDLAKREFR